MILSDNPDRINEELIKGYEKLNEYIDVPGLIELRELLVNLRDDECFKFTAKNFVYDLNDKCIEYKSKYSFFKQVYKALGEFKFVLNLSDLPYSSFIALYSIISYSCGCKYGRDLSDGEKNDVLRSNLSSKISLGLDNFKDIENCKDFNKDFLKKLSSIKWDKRAKKLHSLIHSSYILQLGCLYNMDSSVAPQFSLCSRYLVSCICLSKNKSIVTPEDVVSAWFLTFKLLHTDLRPYIFDISDEEKVF